MYAAPQANTTYIYSTPAAAAASFVASLNANTADSQRPYTYGDLSGNNFTVYNKNNVAVGPGYQGYFATQSNVCAAPSVTNTGGSGANACVTHNYSCPTSFPAYTLSGSSCTRNTSTCTSNGTQSLGDKFLPIGTSPHLPSTVGGLSVCYNGCTAYMADSPSDGSDPYQLYSSVVNGVKQYYMYGGFEQYGSGAYASQSCTAGTTPLTAVPATTCATGQTQGTVNGKTVCVNSSTGAVVNPNQPQTTKSETDSTVTNGDGSKTVTSTVVNNNDNSTTTTTTTYNSSGVQTGQTVSTTPGTNSPNPTAASQNAKPETPDICLNNPDIPACKDPASGTASATTGLYTKDTSGKTVSSVINNFKSTIQGAGFYSSASSYFTFTVPTGSCSGLNSTINYMGTSATIDLESIMCSSSAQTFYNLFSIAILIGAGLVAFRIAIL